MTILLAVPVAAPVASTQLTAVVPLFVMFRVLGEPDGKAVDADELAVDVSVA
jgi:hypothetical protein